MPHDGEQLSLLCVPARCAIVLEGASLMLIDSRKVQGLGVQDDSVGGSVVSFWVICWKYIVRGLLSISVGAG